jgi:GxxExxY protein
LRIYRMRSNMLLLLYVYIDKGDFMTIASGGIRVEPDQELDELAREVIAAAIEVHRVLGPGFSEEPYHRSLFIELSLRGIQVREEVPFLIDYKGHDVGGGRLDLFVGERLIVEVKAVLEVLPLHIAQTISYLKAHGCLLGLLINFRATKLSDGVRRVIWTPR